MIVQVSVYDKIITKVYAKNDQFSQKNCNRTHLPYTFRDIYLYQIIHNKILQLWRSTFIVIPQYNISMTMTNFEDTLHHLLRGEIKQKWAQLKKEDGDCCLMPGGRGGGTILVLAKSFLIGLPQRQQIETCPGSPSCPIAWLKCG